MAPGPAHRVGLGRELLDACDEGRDLVFAQAQARAQRRGEVGRRFEVAAVGGEKRRLSFGQETGESINMGLLDGKTVVVTLRVVSPQPLRFEQPVGSRIPVHCSSMGKSLLAFDAANGPEDLGDLEFTKVTENSIRGKINWNIAAVGKGGDIPWSAHMD